MFVMKKHVDRRTVLRGLGATIALPLLDCMIPAYAGIRQAATAAVRRLGVVYVPNGMAMDSWTPTADGSAFELTPILAPLAPVRDHVLLLSNLMNHAALSLPGEGAAPHAKGCPSFLSGVHPPKGDIRAGVTMDQFAARELGKETQLASLELGLDGKESAGNCDGNYSCAYVNSISWRSPTTPNPVEINPRAVFERLFGVSDSTDRRERLARARTERSILDSVNDRAADLQRELGVPDRTKLAEYLEAIRDVERRIQKVEQQDEVELPTAERPIGIPQTFEEHIKLMFDLQVLAYQSDLTRVITFMIGREVSTRAYPEIGVPDAHHPLSHHGNDPQKIQRMAKVNTLHMQMFSYYLEKLRQTPDGDGSLLDHMIILYGASISESNRHDHDNLPILLAGGGAGRIKGARHLRLPKDTPLPNLHLTILDKLGIPLDRLGDSTGRVAELSDV